MIKPEETKYLISEDCTIKDALIALNHLSSENLTLFVLNSSQKMVGTVTDGDIRRKLIEDCTLDTPITTVMNTHFRYIKENRIDVSLIKDFKDKNITLIPILSDKMELRGICNLKKKKSMLPVDAVLMAGGKGERLKPLTDNTPKPLLKIGGKSIIDYNVDSLIDFGIENISVTVNYLKDQLIEHFKDKKRDVQVHCVIEPQSLGTIGSVKLVEDFHNDYLIVMNSDLFTNINYEEFFLHFIAHNADMSAVAIPYSISIPYGVFNLNGREVEGIQEKPVLNYYANAGIYLFKKELIDLIPENQFFNATDFMELLIKENLKVIRFPLTGYWIDIGKHEEYQKAQELFKHM